MNPEFFNQEIERVTQPLPGSLAAPTHYRLPVKKKYEGYNIIDFFLEVVPRSTRTLWEQKIVKQQLLINGKPAQKTSTLKGGYITEHFSEPRTEPQVSNQIELLYQDNQLLILNKPSPLPMHPSGRFYRNSLTEILKLAFPNENFKIIHRLDANTTGIVVLGKNKDIVQEIGAQFKAKKTQKKYLALVEGIPKQDVFQAYLKIGQDKTVGGARATHQNGLTSHTSFKVLERRPKKNQTLLEVIPHTGRTNQIRLHLAELNHPIIGDIGYKNPDYFKNNPLTYTTDSLCLHAWQLTFTYQEKEFSITTKVPHKFQ